MLKGIDPLLGPELLAILRAMGHGDEIVIVDANFPAAANARRLIRVDGVDAPRMARADRSASCRWTISCPPPPSAWRSWTRPTSEPPIIDELRAPCWLTPATTGPSKPSSASPSTTGPGPPTPSSPPARRAL